MWFFVVIIAVMPAIPESAVKVKVQGFETHEACELVRKQVIINGKTGHSVTACEKVDLPPR